MGLDMYLTKKTYVRNWNFQEDSKKHIINIQGPLANTIDVNKINYIEEEVAYWRKANQIHNWFVNNVQDGNDNCGEYYISIDNLKDLQKICKTLLDSIILKDGVVQNGASFEDGELVPNFESGKMIMNEELCEELLPSTKGFFFGSTNYDQWYFEDIKYTSETLTKILDSIENNENLVSFYYNSSW